MDTSMTLFHKAIEKQPAADWARKLNITRQTFSMAKKQQRLSPALAGNLAIELGEPPAYWMAVAAMDAERENTLTERLRACQHTWRKL